MRTLQLLAWVTALTPHPLVWLLRGEGALPSSLGGRQHFVSVPLMQLRTTHPWESWQTFHNLENVESNHSYFCLFFIKSCTKPPAPLLPSFLPLLVPFLVSSNPGLFITTQDCWPAAQVSDSDCKKWIPSRNHSKRGKVWGVWVFLTFWRRNRHIALEKVERTPLLSQEESTEDVRIWWEQHISVYSDSDLNSHLINLRSGNLSCNIYF